MKKYPVIILVIAGAIILLSIIQAVLSNTLSTSGVLMSKIRKETQAYETENGLIREKLFLQESLNTIAEKASKLGFAKGRFLAVRK